MLILHACIGYIIPFILVKVNGICLKSNNAQKGVIIMSNYVTETSNKSKRRALILCCLGLIGIGGLHRLYVGRMGSGVIYLFTGGLFFFGTIFDLVHIAMGTFQDNAGVPLRA